ncbi:MAG: helix-turn-helix transcriptional regulator [Rickettsiales bacterium]|jgi:DNA-binding HxlR family transcriptional regulator|nr:helix-turn-helix transcriptional regulator [Rickettsiales bacterium]
MPCDKKSFECPAEITICLIGNKWKLLVLKELSDGTKRFGELMKSVPGISQKMLTHSLRGMENDGLVARKVYAEVPPKVEYSMTAVAHDLSHLLDLMGNWGLKYAASHRNNHKRAENVA